MSNLSNRAFRKDVTNPFLAHIGSATSYSQVDPSLPAEKPVLDETLHNLHTQHAAVQSFQMARALPGISNEEAHKLAERRQQAADFSLRGTLD